MDISVWAVTLLNRLRYAKMSYNDCSHLVILAVSYYIRCYMARWKSVIIACRIGEQSTLQRFGARHSQCWTSQSRNRTYQSGSKTWLDGVTNGKSTAHATSKTMSQEKGSAVRNTLMRSHYRYIVTIYLASLPRIYE